jgi:hypothetical protein
MRCSSCGAENPEGLKFCVECAAPLKRRCPSCGFDNIPTAKFCGECAAQLGAAVRRPDPVNSPTSQEVRIKAEADPQTTTDGERKTVTALFADIKGSIELMEDLDPEEARAHGQAGPTRRSHKSASERPTSAGLERPTRPAPDGGTSSPWLPNPSF